MPDSIEKAPWVGGLVGAIKLQTLISLVLIEISLWTNWNNQTKTKLDLTKPKQKYGENHGLHKFLVNSDMFGIKKHVLKLGNLMVTSEKLFELNQNQTKLNQNQKYSQNHSW